MIGVKDKIRFHREGLFAKYVISLVGLVVFVLAVNGAIETWINYRATRTALTDAMSEKADATAKRIERCRAASWWRIWRRAVSRWVASAPRNSAVTPSDNSGNCTSNSGIDPGVSSSAATRAACTSETLIMAPGTP